MRIPLWMLIFLPRSTQEKSMQGRWDDKPDSSIIYAYKDNWDWQRMWNNMSKPHNANVRDAIWRGEERSRTLIEPQMKRRGLSVNPPTSKYGYRMGDEM